MVVLGLRERNDGFEVEGIANVAKVRKELFDGLNNRQKVSINLLSDADVTELALPEGTLLVICIPRANRKQRPVFLRGNPMGHTYLRLNEGDRTVANEDVKRMLAEQVEDSRDSRILRGYGLSDLCMETFRAYRRCSPTANRHIRGMRWTIWTSCVRSVAGDRTGKSARAA